MSRGKEKLGTYDDDNSLPKGQTHEGFHAKTLFTFCYSDLVRHHGDNCAFFSNKALLDFQGFKCRREGYKVEWEEKSLIILQSNLEQ